MTIIDELNPPATLPALSIPFIPEGLKVEISLSLLIKLLFMLFFPLKCSLSASSSRSHSISSILKNYGSFNESPLN